MALTTTTVKNGLGASLTWQFGLNGSTYYNATALLDNTGAHITSGNPLPVTVGSTPVNVAQSGTWTVNLDDSPPIDVNIAASDVSFTSTFEPTASELHLGFVSNHAATPSATFNRPANTTAYDSGDLVANNVTAGSVTPMSLTVARVTGGSFLLRRVRLRKSGVSTTNATFRIHFYAASPTIANGDNAAWLTSGSADYLGSMDVATMKAFSDGAVGVGQPNEGFEITHDLASGLVIYALIEARAAYTPASGETFVLTVEDLQN